MAIQTATNQETGERVALVNGEWQPILQSATNAAGAKAFLVGNEWLTEDAAPAPEQKTTANPFMGALGRAASLAGAGVGAVAESAERLGDKLELVMPLSGISPEDIKNKKQLQPLFDWAKSLKDFDKSLGYQPSTQLKELGSNPLKAIPFIAERVVTSSPDMVAAVGVLPAYIVARTKEILDERVKNDGKTLDEATVGDVTAAAGAAIVEGTLERFATKGLIKPTTGTTKTGRIAKETSVQAGTEVAQEELSYLAEAAGTKKGLSAEEALTRGAEAALVGGGLGATVQGAKEALAPKAVAPDAVAPDEQIEPTLEAQDAPIPPIPPTTPTEESPASPSGVVPEPTGTSVPVVSEPGAVGPAEGVAGVEPSGVVPRAEDAGGAAAGKGNVPASVAPDLASVAALPNTNAVFRTKRGSTYAFHNDGTTTRNRSGEGHTDTSTGVQPTSGRTIFLTPAIADQIGSFLQNPDMGTKLVRGVDAQGEPTNKANVVLTEDYGPKKAGTVLASVGYSKEPRIGFQPVEIWSSESPVGDDGSGIHFGSSITEIKPAAEVLQMELPLNDKPPEQPTTTEATSKTTSAAEPVVTRNSPPDDPTQLWAPTVTLDYGNYTIENDGGSAVYSFKAPAKIAPSTSITGIAVASDRTTLLAVNKNGQEILVRIYPDHIRLDKVTGMGFKDHNFGSGVQTPDVNKIFGKKLMDMLESLPAEERVNAATRAIAEKLGVANLDRFAEEYAAMQSGTPLEQPTTTTTEETASGIETPEAQQAEAQGQAAAAVPPAAAEQVAPQEVSVNEDEVRASAVPLPGGRVEPPSTPPPPPPPPPDAEEELADDGDSGISIFEKLRKSRLGEEGPAIADALQSGNPQTSIPTLRRLVDRNWANMSYGSIEALVAQPTFTFLADWSGIKAIDDAAVQLQEMHGFSQSLLAETQEVLGELQRELNPLLTNPKAYRKKFEDLTYGSTLLRYDPSDPKSTPLKGRSDQDLSDARRLDQMYKTIGSKGQQMYKNIKAHYDKMIKLYSDLLDAQIQQLPGMSSEAKENLINVLRKTFEADARIRPFFPLVRRGDFFLRVDEMKGANLHTQFYMYETIGDRNNAKADMINDNPNAKISSGEGISQLRIKTYKTSEMLTNIFDAIDKEDFGSDQARESLKDAIYQVYLNTMPEQSFRNQFIHRADKTGFSPDLLRNMATTASRTSMQLARLKYAPLLRNSLSAARDAVEGRPNMSPFVIEAEKRVDMAMSGEGGGLGEAIAGALNKASYIYFLSGPISALIQPASIYIAAFPILGANHNNVSGAAYELARLSKLVGQFGVMRTNKDGTHSYVAPSLANNKKLPARERDAVEQMVTRGVTQSTYASLAYGNQNIDTRTSATVPGKAGHIAAVWCKLLTSSLMHNTERVTREIVYLASYRLGIKRGLDHDAAINQAVKDVNESLGNYDVTNRPRWTQRGLGKVAFQFRMFQLHTVLGLITNFAKMFGLFGKEGKKAAAIKFFGTFFTVGSVAGLAGLPFFGYMIGAVGAALKLFEEDEDWPQELKDMDGKTWFREVYLPEKFGDTLIGGVPLSQIIDSGPINAFTGYAVAERIGLADISGRDMREAKSARDGITQLLMELMPSLSMALAFADAYDAYQVGDIQKMQERIAPANVRNILAAQRIEEEGVLDAARNPIIDPEEVSAGMLAMRDLGLRTATEVRVADVIGKLNAKAQSIVNKKDLLERRIKFQARKGDFDALSGILQDSVVKFNMDYPEYAMEPEAVYDMVVADLETKYSSQLGMNPKTYEKNLRLVGEAVDNLKERVARESAARQAVRKANEK